jgi:hypothetical protein
MCRSNLVVALIWRKFIEAVVALALPGTVVRQHLLRRSKWCPTEWREVDNALKPSGKNNREDRLVHGKSRQEAA